jgi:hypothetical protein
MDPIERLKINLKVCGHELTAHMSWMSTRDDKEKVLAVGWDLESLAEGNVEIPHFARRDTEVTEKEKTLYVGTLRRLAAFFYLPSQKIGNLDVEGFREMVDQRLEKAGAKISQ